MCKMSNVLEMHGIDKCFPGVVALNQAEFQLLPGEVHALIGENGAGKSTLMKILLGIYKCDKGEILFKGESVHFETPAQALKAGISMIHQEISLMQNVDIAENIWAGREKQFLKHGFLSYKLRYEATSQLLERYEISLNPRTYIKDLSVAQMQLVELARAISYEAEIIIMDEPTSALTQSEIDILYRIVRKLSSEGVSIIFISHKLEEIFEICDRVTVMRDGKYIKTCACSDIDIDGLASLIVGRKVTDLYPERDYHGGSVVLEVDSLTKKGVFENISFQLHEGEILGFCGLMGAGRTETMCALFGIDSYDNGQVLIDGKPVQIRSTRDAIKNGMAMITEDRLRTGAIAKVSVLSNLTAIVLGNITKFSFFRKKSEKLVADKEVGDLSIKISNVDQNIFTLSGGNQQKVILGRWLLANPRILILDEPTRGIDVGSKSEIHKLIDRLSKEGMSILLISSELPELMGMSDRILVMREGKIVSEYVVEKADQEQMISDAFGA